MEKPEKDNLPPFVVWLTTRPAATWYIRNVAARLDPILFKLTNGRLFTFGPPTAPMLTLTTIGRRSGKPRSVHLAAVEDGNDLLIVASAMGQERHPDWRYNIEANPEVEVQIPGESYPARAQLLSDEEKQAVWPKMCRGIPQLRIYVTRTDRNIRVFRLVRIMQ